MATVIAVVVFSS